ncbi:MAG: hypothetical protein JRI55_01385 [Deltaproteobacteria bacterium]|jgi:hypothetical protein|nr:hypothetical protein [Deltaproteobacteria bacterium]
MSVEEPEQGATDQTEGADPADATAEAKKTVKKKRASKKKTTAGASTAKKTTKKKAAKKTATRARKKKAPEPQLPPRALVLTDAEGKLAGVVPKNALVMVKQGVIRDAAGAAQGVDPHPAQKAFSWLVGRAGAQGLDATSRRQRQAQRIVEQLVRACVVDDEQGQELIERLYAELVRVAPQWKLPEPSAEQPSADVPAAPGEPPAASPDATEPGAVQGET